MRAKRIAFYGNFGSGNLGNECTLQVVVEQVRTLWPDAQLLCLCTAPPDVQSRHRIRAVRAFVDRAEALPPHSRAPAARDAAALARGVLRFVFRRIPLEALHWVRGFAILAGCDMLIMPGVQILSDPACAPGGWPYDLFKWSTLAAMCRVELLYLSIGVGSVRHPLSRWLVARSLRRARYRSYRDRESMRSAERLGLSTERDRLYPDLAFGLATPCAGARASAHLGRRIVGLGLKSCAGSATQTGTFAYREYLEKMAQFVSWLHAQHYAVRLLIGDLQYDIAPRDDLITILHGRHVAAAPPSLVAEVPASVGDWVRQLSDTEVVIGSRLHNLILALMLGKPVIALSDHAKVDALLAELGLGRYRMPVETFSLDGLVACFEDLECNAARLRRHIGTATQMYGRALRTQYAQVFSESRLAA